MKKHRQEKSKADSSSGGTAATSPPRAELPGATSDLVSQSSAVDEQSSSKPGGDEEEDMDFDEEDIDRALEMALERKKVIRLLVLLVRFTLAVLSLGFFRLSF